MLVGDESGRVVLWGLRRIKQSLYGSSGVFPMAATILCCWHGAMQGSFQSFCLQQGQGSTEGMAYVAMADMGGVSSSVWKVCIADVEPTENGNRVQAGQRNGKSAGSRRRRGSVSANGRSTQTSVAESSVSKATVETSVISYATTTTGDSENRSSTMNSIAQQLDTRYEVTDVLSAPAVRYIFAGSGFPPYVTLSPSFAQSTDAGPKDVARQVEVFPIDPTSREQPNVVLTNFVYHNEEHEPSCMELRIQSEHVTSSDGKKSPIKAVLYVGMANGCILKHSLKDES